MSTTVDETIVLEESELERAQGRLVDGARVGRYQVLELVGEGGMGAVYAAYDPELDRRVALKVLHQAVSRDSASRGRQRLAREAQAMARLSHPNVITVHDVGTFEGAVFVAMEFSRCSRPPVAPMMSMRPMPDWRGFACCSRPSGSPTRARWPQRMS